MFKPYRAGRLSSLALLVLIAVGCGGSQEPDRNEALKGQLQEIHELYKCRLQDKKQPPTRVEDLRPYDAVAPVGFPSLLTGDVVFVWANGSPSAPAASVLAHEKKAPGEGGLVLLKDGTIKQMTADEFKAAPKAK